MNIKKAVEARRMIDALLGNKEADLVLKNGNIINVVTREIYRGDIAIQNQRILKIGDCGNLIGEKTKVVYLEGKFIAPGFIDSHMHFESSMLTITEFSRLSIPSGTTTIIADPHEIANALGLTAIKAMSDEAAAMPHNVYLAVPCYVPDSPGFETAGVPVNYKDMPEALNYKNIMGIGEIQGFSNVKNVYEKMNYVVDDIIASAAYARSIGKTVDGNAPGLFGDELAAHIICAGGTISCHETVSKEECIEKIRNGVYVFMREGSTQRNMAQCIKAVTEEGLDSRRLVLVTDDMSANDLENNGHMNDVIRRTIAQGIDPVEAIQMATINPASYFKLEETGILAPGNYADIVIISDLMQMEIDSVYVKGKKASEGKRLLSDLKPYTYPENVKNSVHVKNLTPSDLYIKSEGSSIGRAVVVIPDQNLTDTYEGAVLIKNGVAQADKNSDLLLMACVERHGVNGNIGKAFVKGMELKAGAIAESVAHDTHNIMVCGTNYEDMALAVNTIVKNKGGLSVVKGGRVLGELSLKVGGLISDELTGQELSRKMSEMEDIVRKELGASLHAPFMHLSFLALSTSEKWKLTDKGIVDVVNLEILSPMV